MNAMQAWGSVRRSLEDVVAFTLPERCPGCGGAADRATLLCAACVAIVPVLAIPLCARCLAAGGDGAGCVRHPHFQVWPAWMYDERAACVIHAFKYGGRCGLAPALAARMAKALPPGTHVDLVLPLPLHAARRRERGFNQSELLARALARQIAAPCVMDVLRRARATQPQARLDPSARRANLRGAFDLEHPESVRGRSVLLVDDVMTTGATLDAALDTLANAGARAMGIVMAWAQ